MLSEDNEQLSIKLSKKGFRLHDSLKEINCLYEIRHNIGLELSMENVCQQIFKHLLPAMQYPDNASAVIEIDGKRISSRNHDQHITHALKSEIRVNGKKCGHLSVFYSEDKPFLVWEEQRLIDAIASDLARWLERKQVDEILRERLKEITCLYEIRRVMSSELSIDKVCQNIFTHLIPAMQFPEITTAVVELDDQRFDSRNHEQDLASELSWVTRSDDKVCFECYKKSSSIGHILQSKIRVNGKVRGRLSVFYPEDMPYLILEEQKLIDAIASDLETWLERKHLEQALVSVAEEQQHMIGQELHDNLGQQIAAISYQARALEKKISVSGNEDLAAVAASIATQAQTAVIQVKQLAQGLLPFKLEANGLTASLQVLASRISATYAITCDFLCKNEIVVKDKYLSLNLYRIVQEAANNAIRHGGAKHLIISLNLSGGKLCMSICDDGCGFSGVYEKSEATQGMGIKIMQYRAKQHGARLKFLRRDEGGTEVRLEMLLV